MIIVSELKDGDRIRRIAPSGGDVKEGEIVEVNRVGRHYVSIKNRSMGLAYPRHWELVNEEQERVEKLFSDLVRAEEEVKRLSKEIAVLKAKEPSGRFAVIDEARKDVEKLEYRMEQVLPFDSDAMPFTRTHGRVFPEYHVNHEKETVVVRLHGVHRGKDLSKGKAKASKEDRFDVNIGKAIALRRALGLAVPRKYLDAPQQ